MKLRQGMWMVALGACAAFACGCNQNDGEAQANTRSGLFGPPRVTVPAGTELEVQLAQTISSETADRGDAWRGVVTHAVIADGREVIPAGSMVEGVVTGAQQARKGGRARLALGVRAVRVSGRKTTITAEAEPMVAGSTAARNLGAIAGGAAAGALLGKVMGGESSDATKGAIIGSAVATGVVAASKGYQVVVKDGTELSFSVREDVRIAMR